MLIKVEDNLFSLSSGSKSIKKIYKVSLSKSSNTKSDSTKNNSTN